MLDERPAPHKRGRVRASAHLRPDDLRDRACVTLDQRTVTAFYHDAYERLGPRRTHEHPTALSKLTLDTTDGLDDRRELSKAGRLGRSYVDEHLRESLKLRTGLAEALLAFHKRIQHLKRRKDTVPG